MKVSTKGRYALRMMIDIAEHAPERVSLRDISKRQGISVKYLEQIVPGLTRSNLLRSERGSNGGYLLTKEPDQYSVGEILRAIEGSLAPVACLEQDVNPCERQDNCKTLSFWRGLREVTDAYMNSFTLQDFLFSEDANRLNFSI